MYMLNSELNTCCVMSIAVLPTSFCLATGQCRLLNGEVHVNKFRICFTLFFKVAGIILPKIALRLLHCNSLYFTFG